MRMFSVIAGIFLAANGLWAQAPLKNAVPVLSYRVVSEGGINACAVAWCPKNGFYYTAFAGNADYPLETFDAAGHNIHADRAGVDLRSLWYNKNSRNLQGLAYPRRGKFTLALDETGKASLQKLPGKHPFPSIPDDQSTAFNAGRHGLLLFDGKKVTVLDPLSLKRKKTITLQNMPGDMANLNSTSVIYTDIKGYELGFYDASEAKCYFTDLKGRYTGSSLLPPDAPQAFLFRCSYANRLLWLYNADERTWIAYRLF